jgi:hypothetical protein
VQRTARASHQCSRKVWGMRRHQWKAATDKVCGKKRIMKTKHCDQCKHATMRALPNPTLICAMLHKPRFYAPVYWLKDSWGWKRKCEDFLEKNA